MIPPGITAIYGVPGSLKSTIACSYPGRIIMYDFDMGHERVWDWQAMVESGKLEIILMPLPPKSLTTRWQKLDGFMEVWQKFTVGYGENLEDPTVGTIIIDTGTNEWKMCCDAYLEELQKAEPTKSHKQLAQMQYGEPNQRQKTIFTAPKIYGKHLIVVHHETDQYAPILNPTDGRPILDEQGNPKSMVTGKKVPDGFRYTEGMADWVLHTRVDNKNGVLCPVTTIEKSALGIDLVGEEISGLNVAGEEIAGTKWFSYDALRLRLEMLQRIPREEVKAQ